MCELFFDGLTAYEGISNKKWPVPKTDPKFQDGHIHRYHVLIHPKSRYPEVQEDLIKNGSGDFYSHLSIRRASQSAQNPQRV
ncbi:hypothetical protein D9757_007084 [Collybiopsis confluens]|uniref:Uncharacterized protein n=1 Tax=Collybiopsis confluens TaxID=2823264 RepID=A0A8H5FPE3_9AGAR|nr:hypothetical protein D9757_015064 [Collybiopsis confluens]KAF5380763.1 hypothetical protein D9757_007084 [Collybiopsis confluens]